MCSHSRPDAMPPHARHAHATRTLRGALRRRTLRIAGRAARCPAIFPLKPGGGSSSPGVAAHAVSSAVIFDVAAAAFSADLPTPSTFFIILLCIVIN